MDKEKQLSPAASTNALHTVHETCILLKIGNTKCWDLIGTGALKAVRLGSRCTRITGASIANLMENGVSPVTHLNLKPNLLKSGQVREAGTTGRKE